MAAWGHLYRIILKISGPVYSSGSPTGHQRTSGCDWRAKFRKSALALIQMMRAWGL